jgi:membrane-associated HD superfamily phosphohydrolase
MTDTTGTDAAATATDADASASTTTSTDTSATADPANELEKWKALARKNEQRAKENADAAKRLQEIEDAQKTETQKMLDRAEAAEKRATELELQALRADVALRKGLTATQAKRLVGTTLDELEADADELLADLKATRPAATATADGQGKQGSPVGQTTQITSRDQLKNMTPQQIREARQKGELDGLLSGS